MSQRGPLWNGAKVGANYKLRRKVDGHDSTTHVSVLLTHVLDKNMSNSNVGARKHRNIRDHLFIVHGVINSVLNGEGNPIDIQIYDVEKCFDALWLEDCMLDIAK